MIHMLSKFHTNVNEFIITYSVIVMNVDITFPWMRNASNASILNHFMVIIPNHTTDQPSIHFRRQDLAVKLVMSFDP